MNKDTLIRIGGRLWAAIIKYTPIIASATWRWLRKWAPIVAIGIWRFVRHVCRLIGKFLRATLIKPLRGSPGTWLFGWMWGMAVGFLIVGAYTMFCGPVENPLQDVEMIATCDIEDGPESCDEDGPEVPQVRSLVRGIEPNETQYVLKQYNAYVKGNTWHSWTTDCTTEYWHYFVEAEQLTRYPAELIAGISLIEAEGCKFISARNGDGGTGPMQITGYPGSGVIKRSAKILKIPESQVDYKTNYLHNVVVGTVILANYESQLQSRGPGLLAYNRGPGNVRKDMRRAKLTSFKRRVLSDFRGAIPYSAGRGGKPRIYADKVLAGMVMIDRERKGLPLSQLTEIELENIPGSDPSQDGQN